MGASIAIKKKLKPELKGVDAIFACQKKLLSEVNGGRCRHCLSGKAAYQNDERSMHVLCQKEEGSQVLC